MSLKYKILIPVIVFSLGVFGKYALWDFPVSNGKRTGNLVKISKKGKLIKTWEGTLDEGSGDKLTFYFSVKDEALAQEMYNYAGKTVSIYYDEYLVGWPRETTYNVTKWSAKDKKTESEVEGEATASSSEALSLLGQTLFCSLLGSLYQDQELYQKVKEHLKTKNLYLYRQIQKCNE